MKTISKNELTEILDNHNIWINDNEKGCRADLSCADLRYANLSYADLRGANLRYADLSYADLRYANLRGANIDYASLSFSCKTLKMITDDRIKIQYLYHCASQLGEVLDEDLKELLTSDLFLKVVNKFHRVDECGRIKKKGE